MTTRSTRWLVLGAGGLGCPALSGLVAGGARHIRVIDDDTVSATDLHRQILYSPSDVGSPKVEVARANLCRRVPGLEVEAERARLNVDALEHEFRQLPRDAVVLDCTDDSALKFATNDLCLRSGRVGVIGGVLGWRGQIMAVAPGSTCLRCLFEDPPPAALSPACSEVGVLGTAAGAIGHAMAMIALNLVKAAGSLAGRLWTFDLARTSIRTLSPARRDHCPACLLEPTS